MEDKDNKRKRKKRQQKPRRPCLQSSADPAHPSRDETQHPPPSPGGSFADHLIHSDP